MLPTFIKKVMVLLVQVSASVYQITTNWMLFKIISFQPAIVMQLVQVVCNVQILLVSVLAMQATKGQNVMLLVAVIPLVQVAQHVISQQVNVLAIQDTQEPLVIPVLPTTTEQVAELVQVSLLNFQLKIYFFKATIFIFSLWM